METVERISAAASNAAPGPPSPTRESHARSHRALSGIAELDEMQGLWREAIGAWGTVAEFADAHASVTSATVPRARIEAIRRRETIEHDYAPVRERIAERLRVNAAGATPEAAAPTAL